MCNKSFTQTKCPTLSYYICIAKKKNKRKKEEKQINKITNTQKKKQLSLQTVFNETQTFFKSVATVSFPLKDNTEVVWCKICYYYYYYYFFFVCLCFCFLEKKKKIGFLLEAHFLLPLGPVGGGGVFWLAGFSRRRRRQRGPCPSTWCQSLNAQTHRS